MTALLVAGSRCQLGFLALDQGLLPWGGRQRQDFSGAQVDLLHGDSLSVGPEL